MSRVSQNHLCNDHKIFSQIRQKVFKCNQSLSTLLKTGSILLACAQFGAQVIGSDIDFLMVHARTKPSRVGQKKRIKGESFKGNFEQYTLTAKLLDVVVADASNSPWRDNFNFDAIGNI